MHKFILFFLMSITLFGASVFDRTTQNGSDKEQKERKERKERAAMCTLFTQKAQAYAKTMRDDEYAKATLASYKERAALYCKGL